MAIGMSVGEAIGKGMEGYQAQQTQAAKSAKEARSAEAEEFNLEKMRDAAEKENVVESLRLMMTGDTEGAMEAFNKSGQHKMTELEYDPKTKFVSWKDAAGNQTEALLPEIMARYGVDPDVFATSTDRAEAKQKSAMDLQEHKYKMQKKYDVGRTSSRPAAIQTAEWIQSNIKDEQGKPLTPEKAWKMANSGRHSRELLIAKIAGQISAENRANMTEMSSDELRAEVGRRMQFVDEFAKNKKPTQEPVMAPTGAPSTGAIDRTPTSKYKDMW